MCGIVGFAGKGGREDIERMSRLIEYRGPDDFGFFQDGPVHFGHRRLSIVDLKFGHQPISTSCGRYTMVFNGEIYNHEELREELVAKGHQFQTSHSDTETLLLGYKEWGSAVVPKLNGMFGFCIFDKKENSLFLARDHFGQKPLYYSFVGDTFVFSSELKALVEHSVINPVIDKLSLKKYFAHDYIPAPRTLFENVFKLPASHQMTVNLSSMTNIVEPYYHFEIESQDISFENARDELRELITKSVKRCLMSDVPLGVFLSGGVDSSCIAKFATDITGKPVNTFSIGFEEKSYDESIYAKEVADYINSHHHVDVLSIEMAKEVIPNVLGNLDEPLGDGSLLPTFLVSRFAKEHVKVVLGGDAGDELFAGYDPFKALKPAILASKMIPSFGRDLIRGMTGFMSVSHDNMSLDFKIQRFLRALKYPRSQWNSWWMSSLDQKEMEAFFNEPCNPEELFSEAIETWENCKSDDIYERTLTFFTRLYMQNGILCKVDRASMMNSLEVRSPFLDVEIANFVSKLPLKYKFHSNQTKVLLKSALEGLLPNNIIYRKKKGFGIPIAHWLKDEQSFPFDGDSTFYSKEFVQKELQDHRSMKKNAKAFLWNLFVLENTYVQKYL